MYIFMYIYVYIYVYIYMYIYVYIYIYIRGVSDKFTDFFCMGSFIDSTHMRL